MRRIILAALVAALLLLVPSALLAAVKQPSGIDHRWGSQAACCGWSTLPVAADDVYIGDANGLEQTGTMTIGRDQPATGAFSGDFEINGMKLVIPAGYRMTVGSAAIVSNGVHGGGSAANLGGTLVLQGSAIMSTRIKSVTRAAGSETYTFEDDIPTWAVSRTDLWMRWMDDDPADPRAPISDPPQLGGGPPEPGFYRPTLASGMVAPATAITATTVAVDLDQSTMTLGATGAPYAGTRGQLGFPTALASTALTLSQYGDRTIISDTGVAGIDGDFGSLYIKLVDNGNTVAECVGGIYSILHVDDDTTDLISVAGNISNCGTAGVLDYVLYKGVEPGDPVVLYWPAVWDGNGTGSIWTDAGRIQAEWAHFENMGPTDWSTMPGDRVSGGSNFTIGWQRQSATVQPDAENTWFRNVAIINVNEHPSSGTSGLAWASHASTAATSADPGRPIFGEWLDMTGSDFRNVTMMDTKDHIYATGGVHGIWFAGVTGLFLDHLRTERNTDDGIGGFIYCYADEAVPAIEVAYLRSYENIASTDSSQQGIDVGVMSFGDGTTHSYERCGQGKPFTLYGGRVYGSGSGSALNGTGMDIRGLFTGNSQDVGAIGNGGLSGGFQIDANKDCIGNNNPGSLCNGLESGTGETTWTASRFWNYNFNTISDSWTHLEANTESTGVGAWKGVLTDSWYTSAMPNTGLGHNIVGPVSGSGFVAHLVNGASQVFFMDFGGDVPDGGTIGKKWVLSDFIASAGSGSSGLFCNGVQDHFAGLDWDRFFFQGGTAPSTLWGTCLVNDLDPGSGTTIDMQTFSVNGIDLGTGLGTWQFAAGIDAAGANSVVFRNACVGMDTNDSGNTALPTLQFRMNGLDNTAGNSVPESYGLRVVTSVGPLADDQTTMSTIVRPAAATPGSCDYNRPAVLGWSKRYGAGHGAAGDGINTRSAMDSTFAPGRGLFDDFDGGGGGGGQISW